jgi:hypothetical protein
MPTPNDSLLCVQFLGITLQPRATCLAKAAILALTIFPFIAIIFWSYMRELNSAIASNASNIINK